MDYFLVCGLGYLGQHCVIALKKFGVKVIAIEKNPPSDWEVKNLHESLDELIIGDCSQQNILLQTPIRKIRAALIVTTIEKVNIETAIAIRALNTHTRLIVRSDRENLNYLLSNQLGNFVAYEPKHLPANAYALSALGKDTIGFLDLEGGKMRINRLQMPSHHPWYSYKSLEELNTRHRRIITHYRHNFPDTEVNFYQWNPEAKLQPQDTIVYVETEDNYLMTKGYNNNLSQRKLFQNIIQYITHIQHRFNRYLKEFWQLNRKQQIRRVALVCTLVVFLLLIIGTILFHFYYPSISFTSAFYVTAILLLGGYADLFSPFEPLSNLPSWLELFSLLLTLTGTAFVGVLYALLTEALLSSKFQFNSKRPPIPKENHIIIVGFGRLGQKIAEKLQELKKPVLAITLNSITDISTALTIPLISGHNLNDSLKLAYLEKAKSMVIVTDDDIINIEIALLSQKINPNCQLVIRTNGDTLTENLGQLLPHATIIDPYIAAAEAFTGAAFGENILGLSRLQRQTILVTQYHIEANDTLQGLLLSEVAYGYGVIPVIYQSHLDASSVTLPSDDIRLAVGDLLIVLATIEGLKAIELGKPHLRQWQLEILSAKSKMTIFDGTSAIARISGCSLKIAKEVMDNIPCILPVKMYHHQAVRLKKTLHQNQIQSHLVRVR
ncbi:NAD-binding protein [Cyanobacterium aponinum FACHB-4101]|uniref:potassium channel family protein n=1 Tax=Cyanobacterium aponinum TaxID=379064 RepID=UPI001680247C|nr:NAD-binding protein [Cyanobacterium aponinum]MBD2392745.1 NAD-binding protein [Cyanobacterium aponinum FACHB-4101]